jgi:hypothetical protein
MDLRPLGDGLDHLGGDRDLDEATGEWMMDINRESGAFGGHQPNMLDITARYF